MRSYGYLKGAGPKPDQLVSVVRDRLIEILRPILERIIVDDEWYRRNYLDVQAAIAAGEWRSAQEHWVIAGYFEDRLPYPIEVDEGWYLDSYPDVADAVDAAAFADAQQHFMRSGFREGRLPYRGWTLMGPRQPYTKTRGGGRPLSAITPVISK
ncbi:hypothetical protein [Lichenicoccus roseus]|uniref:Uncharacterized protein n=1 Tax=Lichenicoccus roseus TaxID=2683649 RepID=A0A5R9J142_9PROT|nr:hypothetical protein [Lichenicoccus roseus]TLU70563.1 hypothetical protein FE263_21285 [Lichenicoccus roseus]